MSFFKNTLLEGGYEKVIDQWWASIEKVGNQCATLTNTTTQGQTEPHTSTSVGFSLTQSGSIC